MTNHPVSLTAHTRKGAWKVTARTISGHSYHYHMETERDADLLAIALQALSGDFLRLYHYENFKSVRLLFLQTTCRNRLHSNIRQESRVNPTPFCLSFRLHH